MSKLRSLPAFIISTASWPSFSKYPQHSYPPKRHPLINNRSINISVSDPHHLQNVQNTLSTSFTQRYPQSPSYKYHDLPPPFPPTTSLSVSSPPSITSSCSAQYAVKTAFSTFASAPFTTRHLLPLLSIHVIGKRFFYEPFPKRSPLLRDCHFDLLHPQQSTNTGHRYFKYHRNEDFWGRTPKNSAKHAHG